MGEAVSQQSCKAEWIPKRRIHWQNFGSAGKLHMLLRLEAWRVAHEQAQIFHKAWICYYCNPIFVCYTPFSLHRDNHSEAVWTGSVASVNAHGTISSGTFLCRMVPPRRGGPDQSKMVPLASVNTYRSVSICSAQVYKIFIAYCDAVSTFHY